MVLFSTIKINSKLPLLLVLEKEITWAKFSPAQVTICLAVNPPVGGDLS